MKYGVYFDKYEMELIIHVVFSDGRSKKICKVYEKNNFLHLDITADKWEYLPKLNNLYHLFESDMFGVNLKVLYSDLLSKGMVDL